MIKRNCKVRGVGKHSGDRRGEISLLYLFNLTQTHQNACQFVCHWLTQPPVLVLCLSFLIHFSSFLCIKLLNLNFLALFCTVECVYSTKRQRRETGRTFKKLEKLMQTNKVDYITLPSLPPGCPFATWLFRNPTGQINGEESFGVQQSMLRLYCNKNVLK